MQEIGIKKKTDFLEKPATWFYLTTLEIWDHYENIGSSESFSEQWNSELLFELSEICCAIAGKKISNQFD